MSKYYRHCVSITTVLNGFISSLISWLLFTQSAEGRKIVRQMIHVPDYVIVCHHFNGECPLNNSNPVLVAD